MTPSYMMGVSTILIDSIPPLTLSLEQAKQLHEKLEYYENLEYRISIIDSISKDLQIDLMHYVDVRRV